MLIQEGEENYAEEKFKINSHRIKPSYINILYRSKIIHDKKMRLKLKFHDVYIL